MTLWFPNWLPVNVETGYETIISISKLGDSSKPISVYAKKDLNEITYTVSLNNNKPFKANITPRRVFNFVSSVTVNGKVPTGVIPANGKIIVKYTSKIFGFCLSITVS